MQSYFPPIDDCRRLEKSIKHHIAPSQKKIHFVERDDKRAHSRIIDPTFFHPFFVFSFFLRSFVGTTAVRLGSWCGGSTHIFFSAFFYHVCAIDFFSSPSPCSVEFSAPSLSSLIKIEYSDCRGCWSCFGVFIRLSFIS